MVLCGLVLGRSTSSDSVLELDVWFHGLVVSSLSLFGLFWSFFSLWISLCLPPSLSLPLPSSPGYLSLSLSLSIYLYLFLSPSHPLSLSLTSLLFALIPYRECWIHTSRGHQRIVTCTAKAQDQTPLCTVERRVFAHILVAVLHGEFSMRLLTSVLLNH